MADKTTEEGSPIYFQVVDITFLHPMTGDKIVRSFVAEALFGPEEFDYEAYGADDLRYSMKMDQVSYSEEHECWVNTVVIGLYHPATMEKSERQFLGQAFFTPEELNEFGSLEFKDVFYAIEFRKPTNPYFEDESASMHRHKTEMVRKVLAKDQ